MTRHTDAIDRERDEAFREHLREEHGFATNHIMNDSLPIIANRNGADCDTCETYALSVGTEEPR